MLNLLGELKLWCNIVIIICLSLCQFYIIFWLYRVNMLIVNYTLIVVVVFREFSETYSIEPEVSYTHKAPHSYSMLIRVFCWLLYAAYYSHLLRICNCYSNMQWHLWIMKNMFLLWKNQAFLSNAMAVTSIGYAIYKKFDTQNFGFLKEVIEKLKTEEWKEIQKY